MGWKLAYAHNENDEKTEGDINKLISAVQNGQEVRVLVNDQ